MRNPTSDRKESFAVPRRWVWTAALCVVTLVVVIRYFDDYSEEARAAHKFLKEMPVNEIQEIRIEPYTVSSLTDHVIVVRDERRLAKSPRYFEG